MTEEDVFGLLRSYLIKLDRDAARIDPAWPKLTAIVRSSENVPQPEGAFAEIQLISARDTRQTQAEDYGEAVIGGEDVIILKRSLTWQWVFRVRVFAEERTANLKLFSTALKSQFASTELHPLSVDSVSDIILAPWQTANPWEGQSSIDVTLSGLNTEKMIVDTVEEGHLILTDATKGLTAEINYQRD